ncbi:methyltransferase [Roseibium sp. TrichSKD4]|uniref:class I SAM-dependent methyltransferase n=1 Tax=Roseibium sp. TrichSKD4 TaxID=744980 RepID=UPI0001E56750|nr:class I SAM-dependent methyltransferase [Roseibium sp. TrichSKD4]EFO33679.1 methyltransferase [Roseibium sp. TrichSKD4]
MLFDYDAFYAETPEGLGKPTQDFVEFFEGLEGPPKQVLDLGYGQGRDAIFIARLGHKVTGIDTSSNGISQLLATARQEALPISGHVADLEGYGPIGSYDILLVDRTLHMLPKERRGPVLTKFLNALAMNGHLLIADEPKNLTVFKSLLIEPQRNWHIMNERRGFLFAQSGAL